MKNNPPLLARIPPTGERLPFDDADIHTSIVARFTFVVNQFPNQIALEDDAEKLTYCQLNEMANSLAHKILEIQDHRVDQSRAVAIMLDHNINPVVAMMGVLKAGGFFTFVDPNLPEERIRFLLSDSQANILITDNKHLQQARTLTTQVETVINLDEWRTGKSEGPGIHPENQSISNLIYTSGSTGRPKAVIYMHRNLLHAAWRCNRNMSLGPEDKTAMSFSLLFGGAMLYIFGTLLNGGTLCMFDLKNKGLLQFSEWIQDQKITFCQMAPTTFRQFVRLLPDGENYPSLRILLIGGEPIRQRDVLLFKKYFSNNTYMRLGGGTSEALIIAGYFITKAHNIPDWGVPMGFPISGKEILIWDEDQNPVPEGEIGEIVVRSRYLSAGYWRQPDLTAAAFLDDPDDQDFRIYKTGDFGSLVDGILYHYGRKDHQVKVRGHRIELGEVESVLLSHENIAETVVVGRPNSQGETTLIAYIVRRGGANLTMTEIRNFVGTHLPDYMVPALMYFLDAIPLTESGKTHYDALPNPKSVRPALDTPFLAPVTKTEENLAEIWSESLGIFPIGLHDQFLMLGGNSLIATQILSRIQDKFGIAIDVAKFFAVDTIKELATIIEEDVDKHPESQNIKRIPRDAYRVSPTDNK